MLASKGVDIADPSDAQRPTSAPTLARDMANLETETAGPPYSGCRLVAVSRIRNRVRPFRESRSARGGPAGKTFLPCHIPKKGRN